MTGTAVLVISLANAWSLDLGLAQLLLAFESALGV